MKEKIAKEIFISRSKQGLTQTDLARKVQTFPSSISRLERGMSLPSLSFLEKIAKALKQRIVLEFMPRSTPFGSSSSINYFYF